MAIDPYIGQIAMFGGNFAPRGWALCNGQLLSIQQYTALFSILGTTYGGNGQTNFALPNMQGRAPIHWGIGSGLTPRVNGEQAGSETVTLISTEMPIHNHLVNASSDDAGAKNPNGAFLASPAAPVYAAAADGATMNPQSLGLAGGNQPHQNMQPYLAISIMIALEGVFPSRN